jgi:4,4'-diaponeurosporenoate glycosyltransferase
VAVVEAVLALAGWLAGWWLLATFPRLGADGPAADAPAAGGREARDAIGPVDVVVPARDEEANLPGLLDSLAAQEPRAGRVVVVDDGSTDATAALVLARPPDEGVELVTGAPLAPGWAGKPWAVHQGIERTSSEVVVLLDADVTLAPGALAALGREVAVRGGLVSVAPYHRVGSVVERASALFNVVAVMGVGAAWPGRRGRADGANGACLAFAVADHRRAGGHAAAPGAVLEDLALARSFQRAGLPVWMLAGRGLVSYRMYSSARALIEGWSKNIAAGAGRTPPLATLGVVLWVAAMLGVAPLAVRHPALSLVAYVALAVQVAVHLRRLGRFGHLTPLFHPLLALAFVVVFARSAYLLLVRRRVRWRGRDVDVHPRDRHL